MCRQHAQTFLWPVLRNFRACLSASIGGFGSPDSPGSDAHTAGVPQLSSDPGAAYTIYLDFAGFNFTGYWGSSGESPGNTPAFDSVSGSFSAAKQSKISQVWARVAQCYTPFNVNVTTIDPAVVAGQADSDAHRQAYYDRTRDLMHTVIGPQQNSWCGPYGGISYVGIDQYSYSPAGTNGGAGAGWKTDWVFTDGVGTGLMCGQAATHENGHGLSLSHQSDYSGDTYVNEYSYGDDNSGNGTYAPIMGAAYYTQRGAWRIRTTAVPITRRTIRPSSSATAASAATSTTASVTRWPRPRSFRCWAQRSMPPWPKASSRPSAALCPRRSARRTTPATSSDSTPAAER